MNAKTPTQTRQITHGATSGADADVATSGAGADEATRGTARVLSVDKLAPELQKIPLAEDAFDVLSNVESLWVQSLVDLDFDPRYLKPRLDDRPEFHDWKS